MIKILFSAFIILGIYIDISHASSNGLYGSWDELLKVYSNDGRVNYKAIKIDEAKLRMAITHIENIPKFEFSSFSENERKAFWINAYNLAVVKTVIDNYPIKKNFGLNAIRYPKNSIQQIENVWDRPILTVRGRVLSLNDIENKILRPEFKDPRIHFAIVCASIGCPVIRSEVYTADKLDQQLAEQIRIFIEDPKKVSYDRSKDVLYLSPIFKWFKGDFDEVGGVVTFIKRYSDDLWAGSLSQKTQIEWLGYDWSLNEIK